MKRIAYLLGLLVASACLANVIRVPEDIVSLNQAVYNAGIGDTINLSPTIHVLDQQINIDKSIVLIGRNQSVKSSIVATNACNVFSLTNIELANEYHLTLINLNIDCQPNWMIFNILEIDALSLDNCELSETSFGIVYGSRVSFKNCIFDTISGSINRPSFSINGSNYSSSYLTIDDCTFMAVNNITIGNHIAPVFSVAVCVFSNIVSNPAVNIVGSGDIRKCSFTDSGDDFSYNTNATFFRFNGIVNIYDCLFDNIRLISQGMGHPCFVACEGDVVTGEINLDYCANIPYYQNGLCESQYGSQINLLHHNIYLDPLINSDFSLSPDSPCIDAGDPSSPLDPDGTRADIGAYYFCQGEGIHLPDILRTSTEPGFPEPITATLQSTCDPVAIDSARTETGLFTLDSYPSQVAGEFQSDDFQLTFHPSVQGVFTDTLHIWANTDPPHHKIPLVGESGPIPAPVTDLSINILPDLSAQLTWSAVTQTIYGNPVTPDYYLIFYNEDNPMNEDDWYYLYPATGTTYTHPLVARFADQMNYRVVAWKGIDPALLGWEPGMKMLEQETIR